jgi:hypothetical protein
LAIREAANNQLFISCGQSARARDKPSFLD